MTILIGWIFTLFGVIFFFAGGGWSVFIALVNGRLGAMPLMPQIIFAGVGVAIWLLGVILVAVGLIGARRRQALEDKKSRE